MEKEYEYDDNNEYDERPTKRLRKKTGEVLPKKHKTKPSSTSSSSSSSCTSSSSSTSTSSSKSKSKSKSTPSSSSDPPSQPNSSSASKKRALPYPLLAQRDESATPFTPFSRSIPAPVMHSEYQSHEGEVEALKRQADNPDAPSAASTKHITNHFVRKEKWREEKKNKQKERTKQKREKQKQREAAVAQMVADGMSHKDATRAVEATKQIPRTTENMRVFDETLVLADDAEALREMDEDELSAYYLAEDAAPRVLLTSSCRPSNHVKRFMDELVDVIPNSKWYKRRNFFVRTIMQGALDRGFTDMILINEDAKKPHHLVHVHFPDGPTAYYRLTSLKLRKQLPGSSAPSDHFPELILNNFNTRLGHSLGRMFASLFPKAPDFEGRRVVTFHNQRDFIFFRHHRYIFESASRARLQECGPRFTLKLEKLQAGIFDPRNAEYTWIHKPREQGKQKKHQHN